MSKSSRRKPPSPPAHAPAASVALKDPPGSAAPKAAGPPGADPWTRKIPTPVHWVLTLATFGLWAIVWRNPAVLWVPTTLSGALLFLSFADWDIWPFGFFFVVPLMFAVERCQTAKQAFWWSLWTGWVANYGGFYWISGLLADFGQMPWFAAVAICLLMNLFQGLSFAVFGALFHTLRRRLLLPAILLAPLIWVAVELCMPLIFPYYLGNSQYTFTPMIQIAELFGPLAVGAVLFIANGAIYEALKVFALDRIAVLRRRAGIGVAIAAVVVAANIGYGLVRIAQVQAEQEAAPKVKIGMVEADIGIWSKENPEKLANNLIIHQTLSRTLADQGAELIVWPESSFQSSIVFASVAQTDDLADLHRTAVEYRLWIPSDATYLRPSRAPLLASDAEDERAGISSADRYAVQRGFDVPILFGGITFRLLSDEEYRDDPPNKKMSQIVDGQIVTVPRNYRVYNTAMLLDGQGRVQGTYDKTYLLAFGEFIPLADLFPWVYDLLPAASEFTPGERIEAFKFGEHNLGVMICYEDILPAFGRKLAAANPDVLINVTNDAWFGKTAEPYLHLALATFRAVETRKWLLRSTNTGVSAFVDATGEIRAQTSIHDAETLAFDVPMMKGPPTLYVRIGDLIGYLALIALAALVALAIKKGRRPSEG